MSPMPELPVVTVVTVPLLIDTVPAAATLNWFEASNDNRLMAFDSLRSNQSAIPLTTCVS